METLRDLDTHYKNQLTTELIHSDQQSIYPRRKSPYMNLNY